MVRMNFSITIDSYHKLLYQNMKNFFQEYK